MYLKRLESVGFKSFAERINIEFVRGMTAVVGPNGSGKSNITDAIRWVLGEQSVRSLRGSKMKDIIFQGSDSRKALNVAEVKIVLDNSQQTLPIDYDEVSIMRRIYRSGASEFYINKQSVRLKDIIDLFMDSGLGQEAFSIIGQGRVEEILSSQAKDRRTVFEEAAGVLKYKQRKQKAEYKLAETAENLNRLEDIIFEVDQQIGPLAEQAEVAKAFATLQEQLKEEEIALLVTEIEQLNSEWKTLEAALKTQQAQEVDLKTSIQLKEMTVEKRRHLLAQLDESIEQHQADLLSATQQLEQLEGKKHVLNERLKHFSENKDKTTELKNKLVKQKEQLTTQLATETAVCNQLRAENETTKEKITALKETLALDQADIAALITEKNTTYIEKLNLQAAKQSELQSLTQLLAQSTKQRIDDTTKYEQINVVHAELEKERQTLMRTYEQQQATYNTLKSKITSLETTLATEEQAVQTLQAELSSTDQEIAKLSSREDLLTEMIDGFQGFYHGVKNILKAREDNIFPDIHGAVIELITIDAPYLMAIETVLGGQAQHIIVNNTADAREAIAWLRRTNNGRATFLPLTSIQSRYLPNEAREKIVTHPGFIDLAVNLVETDERYQAIIAHLMGHVVIAETLKDANDIAELLQKRYRIVTLDGDIVHPGGSMSGGAKNNASQSLFTREKDLATTREAIKKYQTDRKEIEATRAAQKQRVTELKTLLVEQEQLRREQETLQQKQTSLLDRNNLATAAVEERLAEFTDNQQMKTRERDKQEAQRKILTEELSALEKTLTQLNESLRELKQSEDDYQTNQGKLLNELHLHEITFAEQSERIKSEHEKVTTTKQRLDDVLHQHERLTTDLSIVHDIETLTHSTNALHEQIQAQAKATERLTKIIQTERAERLKQTQLAEDLARELKQEVKHHATYVKAIQKQEVQLNRLDVTLESRLTHLETEYTTTYERARATYTNDVIIADSKRYVAELSKQIEALGAVNLGSIEEYERISERHTSLTRQQTDLNEAKATLYSIIAEMDEVMKERFLSTFEKIKIEFSLVFSELFDGGKADLNLTDPSDVLETGIDIIAQPPGKKLQHLGLLSGGERALTAIALLFAILRVRPVPFCVLDEVEAALDEANVARFARYLKKHSHDTQFIVITHRKGTMEEADVLYGVTMQEPGVTRLVSVELEESLDLINSK